MFFYKAHGLSIQSTINFPELNKDNHGTDVKIRHGKIDSSSKNILSEGIFRVASRFKMTENSVFLIWNDIEICEITQGKEITVNPFTGIEENFLRALILGPAFGILLHQRGRLVLHASTVNINGGAVAFMGFNGGGKSTTTAALINKGYPLVCDDISSVEFDKNGNPVVFSGFPRIKLWPETIEMFNDDLEAFPRIHSESEKRSCFTHEFSEDNLPLKRIYIIEKDDKIGVADLSSQESLIELIRNSYCANIFQSAEQSANLAEYATIVKNVPVKRLNIGNSLDKLHKLVKIVEEDTMN
ncbi:MULTISPECIES: hypothetical protein [Methanobacterium]|uniref:Uncharacterized protein n=1 Tax=Methanobacterium veterum TaxID=408577 RepID=A0A9E5A4F9_9EURY|nr:MULTISPECIES: hypothetical protein [Methanobacterium]MCZ3367527.1 hypothetical protein [Methanobacterium veterum]MCZ3373325.1 hypothetical protein [Methanobacterium veterum]